ncbi:alpha amylase C-terminal domain-containing protein [Marinimicrobium sp. ABcell2]|uniref:alpha amylase C-terminal domain-containing protein n=1 Tax=Marinimicrobium sp. ABcell2 TaxID=3069751 RepID=UPI0027B5E282|nr:alpha amylase C-terminal domain-containing protein [Marinimicrobium sp. ABcell2]MDQ2077208.1 starch-binding protein [Marinimicrobium sp. ABcell2]
MHLFEWRWTDIATECEQHLGPKGFAAVQVSPPQEHIQGDTWWTRYQPVSLNIDNSRSGTRAEFIDMVNRCDAVGVDIYADAVINHMAAGSGVGTNGSSYSAGTSYPEFSSWDFHNECEITPEDYGTNAWAVRNCRLVGLPDLATGSEYVRSTMAAYLNDLISIGVKGFRIDASKHMTPEDIHAVISRLNGNPYIFQEVIDLGGEAVSAGEYLWVGDVTEFKYSGELGNQFNHGQLRNLQSFGENWGFMGSGSAVVFTDNHDNQRGHGAGGENVLTYKDGQLYDLANVYMLAWPYGYPKVMSSYAFTDTEVGPPSSSVHGGQGVNCFGSDWQCEHRWRPIANMVEFRQQTAGATQVTNWWDNGNNQIAFGRGNQGFVVINREGGNLTRTFGTSMPEGEYCNVIDGDFSNGECTGETVYVDNNGQLNVSVPGMTALAIHQGAMVEGGSTNPGFLWDNAYFRGTPNGWGTTPLTANTDSGLWETVQTFGSDNPRFKISREQNWEEAYPTQDFPIEDGPGDYLITFNDDSKAITATKLSGGTTIAASNICYDNAANFSNPHIYYWNPAPSGSLDSVGWPGVPMSQVGDYVCFDPQTQLDSLNIVFNDNGGSQTSDLTYTGAGCYQGNQWVTLEQCGFTVH